jgi:hypothetical protein
LNNCAIVFDRKNGFIYSPPMKITKDALTSREFAAKMGVTYFCVIRWLRLGIVPGAVKQNSPAGEYWAIPVEALKMDRPKSGRPRKEAM